MHKSGACRRHYGRSTPADALYGLVFLDCHLTNAPQAKAGGMSPMRPWFPNGQTAFIRCQIGWPT